MSGVTLPEALERAASALPEQADAIRPANGDPAQLLEFLDVSAAARVLDWLLRHEAEAGAELAASWAEDVERGAPALAGIDGEGLGKTAAKALRRARHRLRSRGVELPERRPDPVVAKLPAIEERLEAALVSAIDPQGSRAAYLVEPHPSGGARLFEMVLDEERGIVAFDVYAAGRSRVRKFAREVTRSREAAVVEVPLESLRALVARTAAGQPADRALPRSFGEWRSNVTAAPEGSPTPGELARQALGDEGGSEALARVAESVRRGELGPWPSASPALRKVAESIVEIREGRIVVSGPQRRRQVEEAIEGGLGDVFGEAFGVVTARRLEESAYVLWKSGREDAARDALAASRGFAEMAPAANPVARALLEVSLGPVLSGLEEDLDKDEAGSLLVKP